MQLAPVLSKTRSDPTVGSCGRGRKFRNSLCVSVVIARRDGSLTDPWADRLFTRKIGNQNEVRRGGFLVGSSHFFVSSFTVVGVRLVVVQGVNA